MLLLLLMNVWLMVLRDGVLVVRDNGFLNLDIEGDSKVVIDCYNKKKWYT